MELNGDNNKARSTTQAKTAGGWSSREARIVTALVAVVAALIVAGLVVYFVFAIQEPPGGPMTSHPPDGEATSQPPNIVILFADDLGYGDLEMYGQPVESSTPNLNKMAEEGLVFTQFYAGSSLCSPSRASLMTGRYAPRSGVWPVVFFPVHTGGLPHNETTIAEIARDAGYSTSIVGKWHLGVGVDGTYLPTNQGFDEYFGIPYSHDMCPCPTCYYPAGPCADVCLDRLSPCPLYNGLDIIEQPVDLVTLAERFASRSTSFIERSATAGKPFLLYHAFFHPHGPQFAGREFRNATRRGTYGDSLAEMDWTVGRVMEQLELSGVANNTIVFFMSDNGPGLSGEREGGSAGPFKCGKGTTYEGGQRVPAIAHWPGRIAPGRTTALAATMDILPTIVNLVNGTAPSVALDGVDMAPILFEGGKGNRETFYYYHGLPVPQYGVYAVRHGKYKAFFYTQGNSNSNSDNHDEDCRPTNNPISHDPPLLYDLDVDPGEKYNLSTTEYASVVEDLKALKLAIDSELVWGQSQTPWASLQPPFDPVVLDVLPCCNSGCTPYPACCQC